MAANHYLRRLASASTSVLSHWLQPPHPTLLRLHLALSSSASSTDPPPAAAVPEAAKKSKGEEAAGAKAADVGARKEDGADDDRGVHVNKATGEISSPRGPEPTWYGDWERSGRCSDF